MRKKSHISLAKYIVDSLDEQTLPTHNKAFYLGSILPDCKPSFLTTKHEMQGTFFQVEAEIKRLSNGEGFKNLSAYFRDLGQVIHYVADYFTFPHNSNYSGTLRDHCTYEKKLKLSLKKYIQSGEAARNSRRARNFCSPEAICEFIKRAHEAYMDRNANVEKDCHMIVALCHQVVEGIIRLFQEHERIYAY